MAVRTEEARGEVAHKLHREVSTIGLLFVCLGSVTRSGWLFGALYASQIAGPASIISWVPGALVMLVLRWSTQSSGACTRWRGLG